MAKPYETIVIPKGTILFRSTYSVSNLISDFAGIQINKNNYCLYPNYNVFFYPFPFVSESVKLYEYTSVYVLNNDVKLINLILPSKYSRKDRITGKGGIISCDKISIKGCEKEDDMNEFTAKEGFDYDPCINYKKIAKDDNDVVGMIAIAEEDSHELASMMETLELSHENNDYIPGFRKYKYSNILKHYNKYYKLYEDSKGTIGVPEIILYPRKKVLHNAHIEKITDYSDWIIKNNEKLNYSLLYSLKNSDLETFINTINEDKHININKINYKVGINKETNFYQLLDFTEKNILIDFDNNMEASYKEFKFTYGKEKNIIKNIKEVIEKQEKLPLNVLKRIEDWKGGDDELDLSNLGLVNIEFILPENVKRLNLSNNKLGLYDHFVGYDKNELEYLPNSIEYLNISNNFFVAIYKLPLSLKELIAKNNKIHTFTYITPHRGYFSRESKNLIKLDLENNDLDNIPKNLPDSIKYLNVKGNDIKSSDIKDFLDRNIDEFYHDDNNKRRKLH